MTDQHTSEQIAIELVAQLKAELDHGEDAETGIAVYKAVNWIIHQLEEVKLLAMSLVHRSMEEVGTKTLKTRFGSAGWTKPAAKRLNERAWLEAVAHDPDLMSIQHNFDLAEAALNQAQKPFMELPEPSFFIR